MDVAGDLVESSLRLNGYLTLSELVIQGKQPDGSLETLTGVDIVAVRSPAPCVPADAHRDDDCRMVLIGLLRLLTTAGFTVVEKPPSGR